MPTVDFPGMRSMRTDSACMARQRSSARPVIFEYFTPASGLNSNVAAFDSELAALLFEQARAVHQFPFVDAALLLARVEQGQRRERVLAFLPIGRGAAWAAFRF